VSIGRTPAPRPSEPESGRNHEPLSAPGQRKLERDCGCEDLAAVLGDQHVLLEAHAAKTLQFVDAIPVDAVAALA
jgi:hypothetical protein